ncbi:MAG: myristoyl transferase [Hyphomicrobiales bacterium]|nr:MAG: myristoyl transferase [Hyphomicrobiales bacterium]
MQGRYRFLPTTLELGKIVSLALAALFLSIGASVAADSVKVRFAWKIKGEYAPFYVALEHGFFERHGLDVTMGEGAGSQAALAAIIQGQEDFFVGPGIFALSGIQKGIDVKIIAMYHPSAPIVLVSHPDKPVRTPADLEGMKIATSVGETGTAYLDTLCKLNNVDCAKIDRVMMDQRARSGMFMQRSVDVMSAYTTNDLPLLKAATNEEFVILDMPSFGLTVPGMAVVASDKNIAERADVVRRFLAAVDEGYKATIADPAAAAAAIAKHWNNAPEMKLIEEQVVESVKITPHYDGQPLGYISPEIIEFSLGLIKEYENESDMRPAQTFYTNDLLPNGKTD